MGIKFSNNASATLASAISASATSIAVTSGNGALFPVLSTGDYFYATLIDISNNIEVVKVTARTGDTLTVLRGQDGTTARTYIAGDKLELRPTAAALSSLACKDGTETISSTWTFSVSQNFLAGGSFTGTFSGNPTFSGTPVFSGGGSFAGTYTGTPTFNGNLTFSGNPSFTGAPAFTGGGSFAGTYTGTPTFSGNLTFSGSPTITGTLTSYGLTVGNSTSSTITMVDTDEGNRQIHCNSNNIGFLTQAGGWGAYCDDNGNWTAAANVTAYSDERLKTNWQALPVDFVERLANVKHGIYDRLDIDASQAGVSAQSLQAVLPQAVEEQRDGMLSVAYGNAALVACIELAKRVVALEAELKALKGV